jgi:hypothetical protein
MQQDKIVHHYIHSYMVLEVLMWLNASKSFTSQPLCRKPISLVWTWPAENYNACQITTNKPIYNHVVVKAPTDME